MSHAFIAAPRPGEDRAAWLATLRRYRDRVRHGNEEQQRLLRFEGTRGWVRLSFDAARGLALTAGDELSAQVELRWLSGNNELRFTVEECASTDERSLGSPGAGEPLAVPRDGAWHALEARLRIPDDVNPSAVLRPVLGMGFSGQGERTRLEMRVASSSAAGWAAYDRADLWWASGIFSCHFTFLYDQEMYDPRSGWRVRELIADGERRFGGYDAVVLWQAYPRIGVDDRNQFDHYRDMPGGLDALRGAIAVLHSHGVRVFLDYNPWDQGTRREGKGDEQALAELAGALEADGIFLDTMNAAPPSLRPAVDAVRPGVVFAPEGHPTVAELAACNVSWAQELSDPEPPGLPRLKWIEPRHMQQHVRRWETSRRPDIETAFFNGSGVLVWENVFGTWNPWSPADAALWKKCSHILRAFAPAFANDSWEPFIRTRAKGLFAHRWHGDGYQVITMRNVGAPLRARLLLEAADIPAGSRVFDVWHAGMRRQARVTGDVETLGCLFVGPPEHPRLTALLQTLGTDAGAVTVSPQGRARPVDAPIQAPPGPPGHRTSASATGMASVPGGIVAMYLSHVRRECGCHPDPGTHPWGHRRFLWGSPWEETLEHHYSAAVRPFRIDIAQVSNGEFRRFLAATGYQPRDAQSFLRHWDHGAMPGAIAELPAVYVDLDDARAYARWAGKRLPTEPEWQRAAQGTDGRAWPWGNDFDHGRCTPLGQGPLPVLSLPAGRSPCGCHHMSGNVWEWTESERSDGHTRFAIIRGGSSFRAEGSMWYLPGGPQPCTTHTKLLLVAPGVDRSPTIGFRCVAEA